MTTTEIKKALYKQKPLAYFIRILKGLAYYEAFLAVDESEVHVIFEVPVNDMGDAAFESQMPAQLLNRWIVNREQE